MALAFCVSSLNKVTTIGYRTQAEDWNTTHVPSQPRLGNLSKRCNQFPRRWPEVALGLYGRPSSDMVLSDIPKKCTLTESQPRCSRYFNCKSGTQVGESIPYLNVPAGYKVTINCHRLLYRASFDIKIRERTRGCEIIAVQGFGGAVVCVKHDTNYKATESLRQTKQQSLLSSNKGGPHAHPPLQTKRPKPYTLIINLD